MPLPSNWPTVLYLENSVDDALLFRVAYNKTNPRFNLQEANCTAQAMQFLESFSPTAALPDVLVLLDYSLNCETGLDLLRWVRQSLRFCNIPVVIFSGQAADVARDCYEAGAAYCVEKGTDYDSLVDFCACLDRCLSTSPPDLDRITRLGAYQPRPLLKTSTAASPFQVSGGPASNPRNDRGQS